MTSSNAPAITTAQMGPRDDFFFGIDCLVCLQNQVTRLVITTCKRQDHEFSIMSVVLIEVNKNGLHIVAAVFLI